MLFYGSVGLLLDLLAGRREDIDLDRAALELAAVEYPGLNPAPFLGLLDSYAAELRARLGPRASGSDFVMETSHYLFEELGFRGNTLNYYDVRNSCLNDVLTTRLGIPITLSLVYIEIARRLNRPVQGVGMPGHFLVRYDDGSFSTFIDPFHGGTLLTAAACFELSRQVTGVDLDRDPALLAPSGKRQIAIRMTANLRGVYFRLQAHGKLLRLLDVLIAANPNSAEEYKQRGMVQVRRREMNAARADFEHYLRLAPDAHDREEIEKELRRLREYLVRLN